nr:HEAT repeat domain-containing protein [Chloroflexota bacterium]
MKFDPLSALIGFAAASLLYGLLYRFRQPLAARREALAAWFAEFRERLTSSVDQRYRQDVSQLGQSAHLAGSIIRFDDIYIPSRFWANVPPLEPGRDFEPDLTHVAPATLDYPDLSAVYQSPGYTLRDLARAPHNLLIVGRPGAGKSMALVQLGLRAAALDEDFFPNPVLPVRVHAGDLDLPLPDKTELAQPLIAAASLPLSNITAPSFAGYFKKRLKEGTALLLLDGLDDLPPAHQTLVIEWLRNFKAAYGSNRIIATGPAAGYAPLMELGFVPVVMGGWSASDFRALVDKWVAAWVGVIAAQKRRRRRAEDQLDPALVAGWLQGGTLGRTPLDVTLKYWTGLAGDASGSRPVDWLDTFVKRLSRAPEAALALETAAAEMLARDRYGLGRDRVAELINARRANTPNPSAMDPQDIVDELAGNGGLLARRAGGRYSLCHPVVAGYLAAKHATAAPDTDLINTSHLMPTWAPAMRFYASTANPANLAAQRLGAPPDALQTDLFVVANWLGDAPATAPWRADVFRRLAQLFINTAAPTHLRSRAVSALVASRDENVAKLFKQTLASPDPVARQFAAIALGALSDLTAVPELKHLLSDADLYVRWAGLLALAVIGDNASIEALGTSLLEGDEALRRAVCQALALHPTEGHAMLKEAIADSDVTIRRGAVAGLQRIGNLPWVLEALDHAYANDTQWLVRSAAEAAANELRTPPDNFPAPLPSPDQIGWLVGYAAARSQGVPAGPESRAVLLRALQDGDEATQAAAADVLGRMAAADAITPLTTAVRQGSPSVRETAYQALANISIATGQKIAL